MQHHCRAPLSNRSQLKFIEVVPQPRITPEGKAQADSKAQHTVQYVSISRGLQRRPRVSDGVVKPLLLRLRSPELVLDLRPIG
jgi:hypothetical protein